MNKLLIVLALLVGGCGCESHESDGAGGGAGGVGGSVNQPDVDDCDYSVYTSTIYYEC